MAPAGTAEFSKRCTPQKGDIVSFKHRGFMLTSKKPKFPTLHRLRTDITWADVVNNWQEKIPISSPGTSHLFNYTKTTNSITSTTNTTQHNTTHRYTPLRSTTQSCTTRNTHNTLLILVLAPRLRRPVARPKPKGYWHIQSNRRQFLTDFAQEMGFDPSDAARWTEVTYGEIATRPFVSILPFIFCYLMLISIPF